MLPAPASAGTPYSGPNRARADSSCSQTAEAWSPCRIDPMTIIRTPTSTSAAGRTQRRRFLGISAIAAMHPAGRVSRRSIVAPPQLVVKVMIGVIGYAVPVPPTTYCQAYDPGPQQQHVDQHAWVGQVDPKVLKEAGQLHPLVSRPVSSDDAMAKLRRLTEPLTSRLPTDSDTAACSTWSRRSIAVEFLGTAVQGCVLRPRCREAPRSTATKRTTDERFRSSNPV